MTESIFLLFYIFIISIFTFVDPIFSAYSPGLVTAGGSSSCLRDISAAGGALTVLLPGPGGG